MSAFDYFSDRLLCFRMFATAAAMFSVLLIITGVAKIARPHDVERALTGLGLPRIPFAGVLVGLVEVAVGAAAILTGAGLLAQGILYAIFALWILAALRLDVPLASCGCLGRDDTPPSWGHLALNVIAAGVSFGAVSSGPIQLSLGIDGIARIGLVAVGVFLAYVVLTDGARLAGARTK